MVWSDGSADNSCSCKRPEPVISIPAILHPAPRDLAHSSNLLGYTHMHADKALIHTTFSERKKF